MDKALLTGINLYNGCPLYGCCNDVDNVENLLIEGHGFKPENIVVLKDGDATTNHILTQLNAWLVQGSQPGDRLLFHYSGHGAQVPNASEPDGLSEVICPVDFDWSPSRMITDKQLVSIFSRLPHGVTFNWISDSCHSGDLDREMLPPPGGMMSKLWKFVSRAKAGPVMIPRLMPGSPYQAVLKKMAHRARSREMCGEMLEVGFVAGCRSNQTSADTRADGMPCGALTYFLMRNLRILPKDTPLSKLVEATSRDLEAAGYSQRPQVDGTRANSPFLMS